MGYRKAQNRNCQRASGFDRSRLHRDEGPPIGRVATQLWPWAATVLGAWLLRWN